MSLIDKSKTTLKKRLQSKRKKEYIKIIAGVSAAFVVLIALFVLCFNRFTIEFNVNDNETVVIEYGIEPAPEQINATYKASILKFLNKQLEVSKSGEYNLNELGEYQVTYSAKKGKKEASINRIYKVEDNTAPEITLVNNPDYHLIAGEQYVEEGYTATDNHDGDITANVVREEADGKIIYTVADSFGNQASIEREIVPPEITINGESKITVDVGGTYTDEGCVAVDNADGDITANVVTENTVDTSKVGVYTVIYTVLDSTGNMAKAQRAVYVVDKQSQVTTIDPGEKVVYLTFDDGPYKYTQQLLDVLDKYGVKVTFFVTNQYPDYKDLIGEEYRRGHTVAIHSCSHKYDYIYASEENFYADLQQMSDICEAQTGEKPTIIRFPGGASNTTSAKYCKGIMSSLTESVGLMGYQYCDWNVGSGDAGETTDTSVVVQNVISGMQKHKVSVVLQHDIKGFSVDAVEEIIQWGLANGYKFLPLDSTSPMVHHGVNN